MDKRLELLHKASNNTALQQLEIESCKADIMYFFNNYLYTGKNSTLFWPSVPDIVPFIPFPFQKELITEVWESIWEWNKPVTERKPDVLTNVHIDKSRQMGVSWVVCGIFVYWFIFHHHKYTVISRSAEEVDKLGDMDSLFEKMRFMLRHLPDWMLPAWFSKEPSKNNTNAYMMLSDPNTQASITGKTANADAGRWGTRNAIFMDEMASMQYAHEINMSAGSNTPCIIYNSTPKGEWNEFYRMKQQTVYRQVNGVTVPPSIKWLRYHWKEHPHYDEERYKRRIQWWSKEKIAQELEIDYNVAVVGRVYPDFPKNYMEIVYDPLKPLYVRIDNSHWWADPHALLVVQLENHYVNIIDCISVNCSVTDMAHFVKWTPKIELSNNQLAFLERYRTYNWQRATFVSDPYDTHSKVNQHTIFEEYRNVGIYLNTPMERDKQTQIMKTKANIYRIRYNSNCSDFASALMNARYPERAETSNATTAAVNPVHDWTSHYRTALEYGITFIVENPIQEREAVVVDTRPRRNYVTWELIY